MARLGKCCCEYECPDPVDVLPDWTIDGFTNGPWVMYADCCWSRSYNRSDLTQGIETHTQDIYRVASQNSVVHDFTGWWIRNNWKHNGAPPVGSLFTTPLPNTCWNTYGIIASFTYERQYEKKARQEVAFQVTSFFITIQEVYNTCTATTEYYVQIQATIRISNRTQAITYDRYTNTMPILDTCYEDTFSTMIGTLAYGSLTFSPVVPFWSLTSTASILYQYASLAAIPTTLNIDLKVSPVTSVDSACFAGHVCRPYTPFELDLCIPSSSLPVPPALVFGNTLASVTDNCLLSTITFTPSPPLSHWSTCNTLGPTIPDPGGDMFVPWTTCALPLQTMGYGGAFSSVSSCPSLTVNTLQYIAGDYNFGISFSNKIRRKASCSPLDLIPCNLYNEWFFAPKSYPVTQSYRDLVEAFNVRTIYSLSDICMVNSTFTLEVEYVSSMGLCD